VIYRPDCPRVPHHELKRGSSQTFADRRCEKAEAENFYVSVTIYQFPIPNFVIIKNYHDGGYRVG